MGNMPRYSPNFRAARGRSSPQRHDSKTPSGGLESQAGVAPPTIGEGIMSSSQGTPKRGAVMIAPRSRTAVSGDRRSDASTAAHATVTQKPRARGAGNVSGGG